MAIGYRDYILAEQERTVTLDHGWDNIVKDPSCLFIRPVVQNRTHKINAGSTYRFRRKEVMLLALNTLEIFSGLSCSLDGPRNDYLAG